MTAQIIPLFSKNIQGETIQLCNARDLHASLQVGKLFAAWITERIEQYGFIEGEDFLVFSESGKNPKGGRPLKEYHITLDMAKELAMIENNDQGRAIRKYFIAVEKEARKAGLITTINPEQQCVLHELVERVAANGRRIRGVWKDFNKHFRQSSYKQLPASKFDEAVAYLEGLSGEYLPKQELSNALRELRPAQSPIEFLFSDEVAKARAQVYQWYDKCRATMKAAGVSDPGWPELNIDDMVNSILLEELQCVRVMVDFRGGKDMRLSTVPKRAVIMTPEEMPAVIENGALTPDAMLPKVVESAARRLVAR